jgi:hypothetical protein
MIFGIGGVAALAWVFLRNRASQQSAASRWGTVGPGAPLGAGFPQNGHAGYGQGGQGQGMAGAPGAGIGSGILGGLATGAALGAGMVAGQALMHRFTDGSHDDHDSGANHLAPGADPLSSPDPLLSPEPPAGYDMGGNDFGVSDPGGWDDSGGGGSDEWN